MVLVLTINWFDIKFSEVKMKRDLTSVDETNCFNLVFTRGALF